MFYKLPIWFSFFILSTKIYFTHAMKLNQKVDLYCCERNKKPKLIFKIQAIMPQLNRNILLDVS